MKQKTLVISFITMVILLFTPLPLLNTFILLIDDKVKLQSFNKKNLFSTDNIESSINYFCYKILKISLKKEEVIVGKDNFLFLGNFYHNIIDKMQGEYPYTFDEINTWTNKLKNIQTWYEDRGVKFVIVIAPSKHTIYNEKLPEWLNLNNKTITDDITNLSLKKGIKILDLRNILKEQKATQLYFTTDTHWNHKGASIAYREMIKYVNNTYSLNYKTPKYTLSNTRTGSGDLANLLKIQPFFSKDYEKNYTYKFEHNIKVCHGKIDKEHNLEQCINKYNPIIGINTQDQYMINEHSLNKDSLLLVCDSFATANSKLYNATFGTIWKFRHNRINGKNLAKFVDTHKPDIVIYQVIERELYNKDIVTELE